jgi:hypothetical protein
LHFYRTIKKPCALPKLTVNQVSRKDAQKLLIAVVAMLHLAGGRRQKLDSGVVDAVSFVKDFLHGGNDLLMIGRFVIG